VKKILKMQSMNVDDFLLVKCKKMHIREGDKIDKGTND